MEQNYIQSLYEIICNCIESNTILKLLFTTITDNFIDWIIASFITYFTVKSATRQFFDKTKTETVKSIMELGLRAMLNLNRNDAIPDYAQVILVKYKGRYYGLRKEKGLSFFIKIRKTIAVIGGSLNRVSKYRPLNYGVLGVANMLHVPVLFDFTNGKLFKYEFGRLEELTVIKEKGKWYFVQNKQKFELSPVNNSRDTMIAIPMKKSINDDFVGGITFDLTSNEKTLYQRILENDSSDIRAKKEESNKNIINIADITAQTIINAYFRRKVEK